MIIKQFKQITKEATKALESWKASSISNQLNANVGASSKEEVYKPYKPIFTTLYDGDTPIGIKQKSIKTYNNKVRIQHDPDHPKANENGDVYFPDINPLDDYADTNYISTIETYFFNAFALECKSANFVINNMPRGSGGA